MEFLFPMCSFNFHLKLRQVALKFVFLFQYLISSIWLLKPFLVLKKSLILLFRKSSWQQFLKIQVSVSTGACLKPKKGSWTLSIDRTRKTEIMEFLFLKCSWKLMDRISHSEASLLEKFFMHQENNSHFMTKI